MTIREELVTQQLDKIEVVITTPGFHPSPPFMEAIREHLAMGIDIAYAAGWQKALEAVPEHLPWRPGAGPW